MRQTDWNAKIVALVTQMIIMWQSQVEIEHYSVVYFDRTVAFEAL